MLTICTCQLTPEETTTLVDRLEADPSPVSAEVVEAIRCAVSSRSRVGALDREFRHAISNALVEPLPPGLASLRAALDDCCC